MWNGKITNSRVEHNLSGKGNPIEDASGKLGLENPSFCRQTICFLNRMIEGQPFPVGVGGFESIEDNADAHNDFAYGSNLSVLKGINAA